MAAWDALTGGVIGVGVGEAAGAALEPVLDPLKQDAWSKNTPRVLDLGTLAQLAASGLISEDAAVTEGARSGYSSDRVQRSIQLMLTAAPVAELLELWRRDKISEALVDHGLAKARIEPQYWDAIKELFYGRLDPAVIATAIQRGIMKDPGFLPVGPPTSEGNVPAFPVSPLDPLLEAQATGIDADRLFVETAIVGLPLSLFEAAQGYFRGILTLDDFKRAVAEGNTRNEWGDSALAVARQILTAGEYAELQLRGYITETQRRALTSQHGMSVENSDLLYNVLGRSIPVHAITTGLARGGVFEGLIGDIPSEYLQSLQRGNLRPEYYNLAYANRYSYPSAFVIRTLAQAGELGDTQSVEQILLEIGWKPDLAAQVAAKWVPTGTAADPNIKKAQTKAWSEAQASYIAEESTASDVQPIFDLLRIDAAAASEITATWDAIRALIRKQLSPTQVKKAYTSAALNPATGVAWSFQDAVAALLARGYSQADATTLLEE